MPRRNRSLGDGRRHLLVTAAITLALTGCGIDLGTTRASILAGRTPGPGQAIGTLIYTSDTDPLLTAAGGQLVAVPEAGTRIFLKGVHSVDPTYIRASPQKLKASRAEVVPLQDGYFQLDDLTKGEYLLCDSTSKKGQDLEIYSCDWVDIKPPIILEGTAGQDGFTFELAK